MIIRTNGQKTVKAITKLTNSGKINFDCVVQRGYVWDLSRQSLLIHSVINDYTVPPLYLIKGDQNGVFDALDGKQRSEAFRAFLNDEFILCLDERHQVVTFDGEDYDVQGKKFSELPEILQEKIQDFSLTVYFFDSCITEEEVAEQFYRLNNGRPLAAVDLMRARARCLNEFTTIASHNVIQEVKGKSLRADEAIAFQIWGMFYLETPDFNTKIFRPVIENAEVTAEQIAEIHTALDMVEYAYNKPDAETKEGKKLRTRMRRKTHIVMLTYAARTAISKGMDKEQFAVWAAEFYAGKGNNTTISTAYNDAAGRGSAKPEAISTRKVEVDTNMEESLRRQRSAADWESEEAAS